MKPPRNVWQVITLSDQLGLELQLVDWYWDTTSVSHRYFLTDLFLRTDDLLLFYSESAAIPSNFQLLEWLEHLNSLDKEDTKSIDFPGAPNYLS